MQRYHRLGHRWLWLLLAFVIVQLFLAAWLSRSPEPRMGTLPDLLQETR